VGGVSIGNVLIKGGQKRGGEKKDSLRSTVLHGGLLTEQHGGIANSTHRKNRVYSPNSKAIQWEKEKHGKEYIDPLSIKEWARA